MPRDFKGVVNDKVEVWGRGRNREGIGMLLLLFPGGAALGW